MKIKICGVTSAKDIAIISRLPVWAIGFNAYRGSPRYLDPIAMQRLCGATPSGIVKVGVFVNAATDNICEARKVCHLDLVQLHGDETPEQCGALAPGVIKAFRLSGDRALPRFEDYAPFVDYFLLDAYAASAYGGTGRSIDLALLKDLKLSKPMLVAGGIGWHNAAALWQDLQPFALDICSAVESSVGIKDPVKLQKIFQL